MKRIIELTILVNTAIILLFIVFAILPGLLFDDYFGVIAFIGKIMGYIGELQLLGLFILFSCVALFVCVGIVMAILNLRKKQKGLNND